MRRIQNRLSVAGTAVLETRAMLAATTFSSGEVKIKADLNDVDLDSWTAAQKDKMETAIEKAVEFWDSEIFKGSYSATIGFKDLGNLNAIAEQSGDAIAMNSKKKDRDAVKLKYTLIHEMGHNLGLEHSSGGIMNQSPSEVAEAERRLNAGLTDDQIQTLEENGYR